CQSCTPFGLNSEITTMQRRWRRTTILSSLAAAATLFCASAPVANAAPPSSAVDVSATTVQPGQEFTVTQTVTNTISDGSTVTSIPAPPNADVAVSLAATPRSGLAARVDYTLTVTNSGPATATGIRVVATNTRALRMSGATGCTGGPNTLNCDVASLAPGGTA